MLPTPASTSQTGRCDGDTHISLGDWGGGNQLVLWDDQVA